MYRPGEIFSRLSEGPLKAMYLGQTRCMSPFCHDKPQSVAQHNPGASDSGCESHVDHNIVTFTQANKRPSMDRWKAGRNKIQFFTGAFSDMFHRTTPKET